MSRNRKREALSRNTWRWEQKKEGRCQNGWREERNEERKRDKAERKIAHIKKTIKRKKGWENNRYGKMLGIVKMRKD